MEKIMETIKMFLTYSVEFFFREIVNSKHIF